MCNTHAYEIRARSLALCCGGVQVRDRVRIDTVQGAEHNQAASACLLNPQGRGGCHARCPYLYFSARTRRIEYAVRGGGGVGSANAHFNNSIKGKNNILLIIYYIRARIRSG